MGGVASFIPTALSIGNSLFGGGGSGGGSSGTSATGVPFYTPSFLPQADSSWQTALYQLGANNPYGQLMPTYAGASNDIQNNPYAGGAQTAAGSAGNIATGAGANLADLSRLFSTEAQSLSPAMSSVINMGMDPQNALYSRLFQQTNDQANVTNAQYGLTGQQAAANTEQADTNFNLDWQNNQLQRALQGIQGAQSVGGTQAGLGQAAGQQATGAVDLTGQGGNLPYAQYNSNLNNILAALTGQAGFGAQGNQVPLQIMQSVIPYLNYGSGATNAATGAAGQNMQANQSAGAGIGSLFSGLSGLFGGNSSPFSGISNLFSSGSGSGSDSTAYGPFYSSGGY